MTATLDAVTAPADQLARKAFETRIAQDAAALDGPETVVSHTPAYRSTAGRDRVPAAPST